MSEQSIAMVTLWCLPKGQVNMNPKSQQQQQQNKFQVDMLWCTFMRAEESHSWLLLACQHEGLTVNGIFFSSTTTSSFSIPSLQQGQQANFLRVECSPLQQPNYGPWLSSKIKCCLCCCAVCDIDLWRINVTIWGNSVPFILQLLLININA